jgi:transposase
MTKRKFTNEFKSEAVKLVLEQGVSLSQASRDLGLGNSTLCSWISKFKEGLLLPGSAAREEKEEVKRLRREVETLRQEREILKKATAFFAKQMR